MVAMWSCSGRGSRNGEDGQQKSRQRRDRLVNGRDGRAQFRAESRDLRYNGAHDSRAGKMSRIPFNEARVKKNGVLASA